MKHLWPDTADTALYWRGLYLGIIRGISPHLTPLLSLLSLLSLSSSDLDILNTRTKVNTKYPDTEILIILRQVSMLSTKQKRRLSQVTGSLCLPFLILAKRLVLWDRVWLYKGWASVGCDVCHVYRVRCESLARIYSVRNIGVCCNDAAFHSNVAQFSIVPLFVAAIKVAKSSHFLRVWIVSPEPRSGWFFIAKVGRE